MGASACKLEMHTPGWNAKMQAEMARRGVGVV